MTNSNPENFWWTHTILSLPKIGESADSSADRAAVSDAFNEIAVADGVSRSYMPGPWAQDVVVESLRVGGVPTPGQILALSNNLESSADTDDWIELERQARGGHATLLHCRLDPDTSQLTLESVGDGLAIVVNLDGWCVASWPFESADQFPQVPSAISSRAPYVTGPIVRGTVSLPACGLVLVMTDALGRFCRGFLDEHGARLGLLDMLPFLWSGIFNSNDPEFDTSRLNDNFRDWVEDAKRTGSLEDDDITLVIAQYEMRHVSGEVNAGA